jgi:alkylation response protein AidB-like acyl-CoA dehydrogenase
VEKIKRDVRITTIYEGTSEIQQNIISTFRWKKSRKSKGGFYGAMAAEMEQLEKTRPGCAGHFYGLAARGLNHLIGVAAARRLTRQQILMFDLADLMAHVEVGVAGPGRRPWRCRRPQAERAGLRGAFSPGRYAGSSSVTACGFSPGPARSPPPRWPIPSPRSASASFPPAAAA